MHLRLSLTSSKLKDLEFCKLGDILGTQTELTMDGKTKNFTTAQLSQLVEKKNLHLLIAGKVYDLHQFVHDVSHFRNSFNPDTS